MLRSLAAAEQDAIRAENQVEEAAVATIKAEDQVEEAAVAVIKANNNSNALIDVIPLKNSQNDEPEE